MKFVKKW